MRRCEGLLLPFVLAGAMVTMVGRGAALDSGAADWPNWRGPTFSGAAGDCGTDLVDDLNDAKLAWKSEDQIPGSISPKGWLCGGFASPVVAAGRVYLGYFVAGGRSDYNMTAEDIKSLGNYAINPNIFEADDVLHCFDAATGKTLWRTAFKGKGVTYPAGKCGSHMVAAVAAGKAYFLGTTGRVYCVDAESGKPVWEQNIGAAHQQFEAIKEKKAYYFKLWWHGLSSCPSVTGGVVAINDCSGGLLGFDAATGKQLWRAANATNWWATFPYPWKCAGKDYFISYTKEGKDKPFRLLCIEAQSGQVVWSREPGFDIIHGHPALCGDYMVGGDGANALCVKLDLKEPKKLWQLPGAQVKIPAWASAAVTNGYVYFPGQTEQMCVELETGKIAGKVALPGPNVSSPVLSNGRMIYPALGNSSKGVFHMYKADPKDLKPLGKPWPVESFANSTSPIVAGGRLYFRSEKNLLCYDLRKNPDGAGAAK